MKRYLFGIAILALAAAGVVWLAIKEQAAATAASPPKRAHAPSDPAPVSVEPAPTATASVSASASASAASEISDAAPTALDASTPGGGEALAPYAAWSVVRWGMPRVEIAAALTQAGFTVDDAAAAQRVRAKNGARDVTIDFGATGPSQIVVSAASLSKEDADAAVAKIEARAPATSTLEHSERRWKMDGDAVASLSTDVDGAKATSREEHVREQAPGGSVGFAKLRWGMSTAEVVGYLTAAGYAARVVKGAASDAETVMFTKGDAEGTAWFNQFGVRRVEVSGPTADGGAARAKELESSFGKPTAFSVSTRTRHVDHGRSTAIDVEVKEKRPGDGFAVIETYRPK